MRRIVLVCLILGACAAPFGPESPETHQVSAQNGQPGQLQALEPCWSDAGTADLAGFPACQSTEQR